MNYCNKFTQPRLIQLVKYKSSKNQNKHLSLYWVKKSSLRQHYEARSGIEIALLSLLHVQFTGHYEMTIIIQYCISFLRFVNFFFYQADLWGMTHRSLFCLIFRKFCSLIRIYLQTQSQQYHWHMLSRGLPVEKECVRFCCCNG